MLHSHFLNKARTCHLLAGLILLGVLAACGDNTATNQNQPSSGGQVPLNTAQPLPTNTVISQHTATPALAPAPLPTSTSAPRIIIDTRPAVTPWDPNIPIPTRTPYPTGIPLTSVPNFGTTVHLVGSNSNIEAEQKFVAAYKQGKPGQWEYVAYGIDSGPTSTRFVYKGSGQTLNLISDTTRASYAAPEDMKIETYKCQKLTEFDSYLEVAGCVDSRANLIGYGFEFPLN